MRRGSRLLGGKSLRRVLMRTLRRSTCGIRRNHGSRADLHVQPFAHYNLLQLQFARYK